MQKSKVSVVVISWNGLDYLKGSVPLILQQTSKDTELIYVLNGSIDGSKEYLESKGVKVLENKSNMGISVAKNQGADRATGDYLLLLDDDMHLTNKDFISNISKFYKTLENPGFLMPLFIDHEDSDTGLTRSYGTYYDLFGINVRHKMKTVDAIMQFKEPIEISICQGGAMFIKKTAWDELGGFDESQLFNLDDDDVSTRANVYGYKNYLYNQEYIVHMGFKRRLDKKRYSWNDKTYYSGKAKAMLKNFQWSTLFYMLFLATGRMMVEGLYHTVRFAHLPILWANLTSVWEFIISIPDTLKKRRVIQSNRQSKDRDFLYISAPEYKDA